MMSDNKFPSPEQRVFPMPTVDYDVASGNWTVRVHYVDDEHRDVVWVCPDLMAAADFVVKEGQRHRRRCGVAVYGHPTRAIVDGDLMEVRPLRSGLSTWASIKGWGDVTGVPVVSRQVWNDKRSGGANRIRFRLTSLVWNHYNRQNGGKWTTEDRDVYRDKCQDIDNLSTWEDVRSFIIDMGLNLYRGTI